VVWPSTRRRCSTPPPRRTRPDHFQFPDPSLRSGFRLAAPASLTPPKRLKFKSARPDHFFFLRFDFGPNLAAWLPTHEAPQGQAQRRSRCAKEKACEGTLLQQRFGKQICPSRPFSNQAVTRFPLGTVAGS